MKTTDGKTGNYTAPMMGIDVRYFPKVVDVKLSQDTPDGTYYKLMQPDTIVLSRPVATSLGNLTVGDRVEILSTERIEVAGLIFYVPTWRQFKVIGIAETNPSSIFSFGGPSLGDPCYISYSTLTDQFGHIGDYATSFFIEVKDEYEDQLTFIKEKIRARFAGKYSLGIITRQDLIEEVKEDAVDVDDTEVKTEPEIEQNDNKGEEKPNNNDNNNDNNYNNNNNEVQGIQ